MSRKQPTPVPARATKPDPPPAPPSRRDTPRDDLGLHLLRSWHGLSDGFAPDDVRKREATSRFRIFECGGAYKVERLYESRWPRRPKWIRASRTFSTDGDAEHFIREVLEQEGKQEPPCERLVRDKVYLQWPRR